MILAVVGNGKNGDKLESMLIRLNPSAVVTGSFWGTDERTRTWAMDNGVAIVVLNPNFIKHSTRSLKVRAEQIAMIADEMLISGVTPSSLQAAQEMQNLGKMVWNEDDFSDPIDHSDDSSFAYF